LSCLNRDPAPKYEIGFDLAGGSFDGACALSIAAGLGEGSADGMVSRRSFETCEDFSGG
jgi:hypothetical protein